MAKICKVAWHEGLQWQSVHTENGQLLSTILMSSPKFQDSEKRTVAAHTIKMYNKSWFVFDFASLLYYFPASGHDNFLMLTCFLLSAANFILIFGYLAVMTRAWWIHKIQGPKTEAKVNMHTGCFWCQISRLRDISLNHQTVRMSTVPASGLKEIYCISDFYRTNSSTVKTNTNIRNIKHLLTSDVFSNWSCVVY